MRSFLSAEINKAIKVLYPNIAYQTEVMRTSNPEFGDYSCAVMDLSSRVGQNPGTIAEEIRKKLLASKNFDKYVSRTEIAGPGFMNFWLSETGLAGGIKNAGKKNSRRKEKISLDYLDANPTGPVHLGHARSGFYGDVLSNILEFCGYKVSREFYVNNAKSSGQIQSLGKTVLGKGEEYKHGQLLSVLERPLVKKKIKTLKNPKEAGFYVAGLIQRENEAFLKDTAKIKFDLFFEEEKVYASKMIKEIVKSLKKADAIYEKDGATWLRSSKYGDTEDRVLIRNTGEPTYLLPDIGYHLDRLVKRKYDKAINIFGADHFGYGPRLKAALQVLGISPEKIKILTAQIVRLMKGGQEFKMSKRAGIFVTLEELIKEVGLDAARFFFLMRSLDTHMDFDLDLAKEHSKKNPVYYVQYAHARACSILRKSGKNKKKLDFSSVGLAVGSFSKNKIEAREEKSGFERNLILKIIQFPEIIEDIAEDYQVHRLNTYVYELAKVFTDFYENVPVLKAETNELKNSRLALVSKSRDILRKSLVLMGISTPEKM